MKSKLSKCKKTAEKFLLLLFEEENFFRMMLYYELEISGIYAKVVISAEPLFRSAFQ